MVSIAGADTYISQNVIDTEDWTDSDGNRKQRLLNVAGQTLARKFSKYTIPDNAIYEFAARLAVVLNDTYKVRQYGVKQFSIKGTSFTFNGTDGDLSTQIPQAAIDLISEANGGIVSPTRRIGRSVR